ncbi:MAG TPA: DNA cytosine methyltransferase [Desulfobulbaceae bacterium]|nr:DNA cytosine methyltransferase [Desulfobulbaceae bacterium]
MYQPGLFDELIIDNFAGGGGASNGIELALGRHVDIAINHDPEAVAMHRVNHPYTHHYCEDVWSVDPVKITCGRPVGLAWFSPDCKHFSKAKGGKPVSRKIRGLAWVVVRYAKKVRPRVIMLENVEEFKTWGPLTEVCDKDGKKKIQNDGKPLLKPCEVNQGRTFYRWVSCLEKLGYTVDWKELRACDYGAPTIRKRLFLVARCDGNPIVWPEATHGPGLLPYRTAADCLDWSIPAPSIFERKRPLAENTMKRIAKGIRKFVIDTDTPFIVPIANYNGSVTAHSINDPLRTITAWPKGGAFALAVPHLQQQYGKSVGNAAGEPITTVTTKNHHALVSSHLIKLRGTCRHGQPITEPMPTVTAGGLHIGEVRSFLIKYYGTAVGQSVKQPLHTVTTKDRLGLVTVSGKEYRIADIGMRMLSPRELFRAQGFDDDYVIDPVVNGRPLTKVAQVRMCGNSVSPYPAKALVAANVKLKAISAAA